MRTRRIEDLNASVWEKKNYPIVFSQFYSKERIKIENRGEKENQHFHNGINIAKSLFQLDSFCHAAAYSHKNNFSLLNRRITKYSVSEINLMNRKDQVQFDVSLFLFFFYSGFE